MASVMLHNVDLGYDGKAMVHQVNLSLASGELGCLLGPSGCGKSTLLRSIAGFTPLLGGQILLDKTVVADESRVLPPQDRGVGLVFQDVALFPHLNVNDNIRFGIEKWSLKDQKARVTELLSLVGLSGLEQRFPHELSGGQAQRVALARAMAPRPKVLLLDEPFSGLDSELRARLAVEVRGILKTEGVTALMVTHDQKEAFDFADRVAVMKAGIIEQFDAAYRLYHEPRTEFVAKFVGAGDVMPCTVLSSTQVESPLGVLDSDVPLGYEAGQQLSLLFRPDDVIHDDESDRFATLVSKQFRGSHFVYRVRFDNGVELGCLAPSHHDHDLGERVGVRLEMEHLVLLAH